MKVVSNVVLVKTETTGGLNIISHISYWQNAHSKAEAEGYAMREAMEKNIGFQVNTINSIIIEE